MDRNTAISIGILVLIFILIFAGLTVLEITGNSITGATTISEDIRPDYIEQENLSPVGVFDEGPPLV